MRVVIEATYDVEEAIEREARKHRLRQFHRSRGACFNCGQLGHFEDFYPEPRQGGPGRNRRSPAQDHRQEQHQQLRSVASTAGQVNAGVEMTPDQSETVPSESDTPPVPVGIAWVYRIGRFAAGGIFWFFD